MKPLFLACRQPSSRWPFVLALSEKVRELQNLPLVIRTSMPLSLLCVRSVLSDSFATPWTVSHQAPLIMEFSKQEY